MLSHRYIQTTASRSFGYTPIPSQYYFKKYLYKYKFKYKYSCLIFQAAYM